MMSIKEIIKSNSFLTKLYYFFYKLIASVYWNIIFTVDKSLGLKLLYGNCFVFTSPFGKIKKNNWGDDLNVYLFNSISTREILFVPFEKLFFAWPVTRYSLIGSIIGDFDLSNTIIYGSGAITPNPTIVGCPIKVLSVRGPLTREVLLKNGIDCPAIYGDPALLASLIYKPQTNKTEAIGVIPHYRTLTSDWMSSEWFSTLKANNDIIIIDMSRYDKWTDVIDKICSCKFIISESLHGLIVSESYSIPSVWVEIQNHDMPWEWDFKYRDFYESINKKDYDCIKLYESGSVEDIFDRVRNWKLGVIDYASMLKSFPFDIKETIKYE